jgi:hypothetical protein
MDWLVDPNIWLSFLTLTLLEIILGIDNLIFIAIVVTRLPPEQRAMARRLGLTLALVMRLALLASIAWIMRLTTPIFEIADHAVSWRDLILICGGVFLLYKGTAEIHALIDGEDSEEDHVKGKATLSRVIGTIILLDLVFSLDSVITAVGMVDNLWVMSSAVIVAVIVMLVASAPVADFIHRHPTVKMLALSFLLLIGVVLVADGFGVHIPKGFVYAAIGFSLLVESLNLLHRKRAGRDEG